MKGGTRKRGKGTDWLREDYKWAPKAITEKSPSEGGRKKEKKDTTVLYEDK